MEETVRAVMLDPDWFGDVDEERAHFERLLEESVVVDAVDCTDDELAETVGSADLLLSHDTGVSAESMDTTGCSVVARYATGIDGIDVAGATDRGVRVTRVPTYCNDEVGLHALSLALAFVRGLPTYDAGTADGRWEWSDAAPLRTPADLTFGLLAFANKGRATGSRALALGFDVCAYDPYVDDAIIEAAGVRPVDYETLLASADVLSIHAPLTDETDGMVDADALARLDDDAVVVNTARGRILDEDALVEALDADTIRGAGLDVLQREPPEAENPLLGRDDVVVTPHAAWYSTRSAQELRRRGTEIAVAAYRRERVEGLVNPSVVER